MEKTVQDNSHPFFAQEFNKELTDDGQVSRNQPDAKPDAVMLPPGPSLDDRLARVQAAQRNGRNALLEAARELLRALAEVPQKLSGPQIAAWRGLLHDELMAFTQVCEHAGIRREHMLAARYVLCTALDEAASLAPWNMASAGESAGQWSLTSLLTEFYSESDGGQKVFMLLGRMASMPQEHMPVLELMHHVLSLGFQGSYNGQHAASQASGGPRELESIRQRLFTLVSGQREAPPRELSAQWRGAAKGKLRLLRAVPVWASASLLGLVLFAQYGWAKYQLLSQSSELERSIHALRQLRPAESAPMSLGLTKLLAPEIAAGKVTVQEGASRSLVVFKGDGMFASGQGQLAPASLATIEKVGQALRSVTGQVRVWGHTDNQPSPDPRGLNDRLSMARAQAVAQVLKAQGVPEARLQAQGKGASAPVAGNETEAGRAQNRRVEIEVLSAPQ